MRSDEQWIAEIIAAARTILDYTAGHSREAFLSDHRTRDAVSMNIVIIGEAIRNLLADPHGQRRKTDAAIIVDLADLPWRAWMDMRNVVTHEYFRRDGGIVWDDIAAGAFGEMATRCEGWLKRFM